MIPFDSLLDEELLALCIYGEARNQGLDGMLAVGSVIINRVLKNTWYGKGLKGVILKPMQFSCFNEDDPNYKILSYMAGAFKNELSRDKELREAYWIAKGIHDGFLRSNVGTATHYHTEAVHPSWADSLVKVKQIGDHIFYT